MIMEFFKRDPEKIQIESDDPVNGDVLIRTWNWHFSPQNHGDKRWPSGYFYLNPKKSATIKSCSKIQFRSVLVEVLNDKCNKLTNIDCLITRIFSTPGDIRKTNLFQGPSFGYLGIHSSYR